MAWLLNLQLLNYFSKARLAQQRRLDLKAGTPARRIP
jgi:hypothetical protein